MVRELQRDWSKRLTGIALLEIPEGTPMLATAIISFDSRSRPFEFRRSCVLTDVMRLYREF